MNNSEYIRSQSCITQVLKRDHVIVYDMKNPSLCVSINGPAAYVWLMLSENSDLTLISEQISKMTNSSRRTAKNHLARFLEELKGYGLIKIM